MVFIIGIVIAGGLVIAAVCIWNAWVLDTFKTYGGPYAGYTGMHAYRRYGIWHISFSETGKDKASERNQEARKIERRQKYLEPVRKYS